MSYYQQRKLSLTGIDASGASPHDLRALVRLILDDRIHGICFSPYVGDQGPATHVGKDQIRERLDIVAPYVRWIRTFSTSDGNELIPSIAKQWNLGTMVGVWLDADRKKNEVEIANVVEVARAGYADILAVGNEVLLRGELSEDELITYLERVKSLVPGVDVGYVDAYFKFVDHPRVTAACDVILANCYPFWEGCPAEYALLYMKEMYRKARKAAGGKKVIISETGWPDTGAAEEGAVPSFESAVKYFVETYRWAEEDGVGIFYFSAFDEAWKVGAEGDVGAHWGLWDSEGRPKYV